MVDPALLARLVWTKSVLCKTCHGHIDPEVETWQMILEDNGNARAEHARCGGE